MAVRNYRFRADGEGTRIDLWLVGLGVSLLTIVAVAGHSMGRLPTDLAVALLLIPLIVMAVALRPAWVVLVAAAAPTELLTALPTRGLSLLGLATLGGLLVTRLRLYVDIKSGMVPIAGLAALAMLFPFEQLGGEGASIARGFLNILLFSFLLGLIAYNAVRLGDLKPESLVNALLVGAALRVVTDIAGVTGATSGVESFQGKSSYIAAMGFMIAFTKLLVQGRRMEDGQRLFYGIASALFFALIIQSAVRATWLACLVTIFLAALWTGRRRYWLVIPIVLVVVLSVPVSREAVLPGSSRGIAEALERGNITTGRVDLWDVLIEEHASPAMPFGNGYGYTFTLSAEDIFGFESFRLPGTDPTFVYPHNDFIYWTVEFGLLGLFLYAAFWVYLFVALRRVLKGENEDHRENAIILIGAIIMMLIVALVDNSFGIPSVTWRGFAAAGCIFGMAALARNRSQAT